MVTGIMFCMICFIVLSVIVYLNRTKSPLALDIVICDFCYNIRGEKFGFNYWFFRLITEFGNFYLISILLCLIFIVTKCDYRAILFFLGIILVILLNAALKEIFARERPLEVMRWMNEQTTSYPSGHSASVGFVYPFLIFLVHHSKFKKKYRYGVYLGCLGIIPLVMISRLILGVHYFTDVIAGFCVGIMVACLLACFYEICKKHNIMTEGLWDKFRKRKKEKNQNDFINN